MSDFQKPPPLRMTVPSDDMAVRALDCDPLFVAVIVDGPEAHIDIQLVRRDTLSEALKRRRTMKKNIGISNGLEKNHILINGDKD